MIDIGNYNLKSTVQQFHLIRGIGAVERPALFAVPQGNHGPLSPDVTFAHDPVPNLKKKLNKKNSNLKKKYKFTRTGHTFADNTGR